MSTARQLAACASVGVGATLAHYAILIALVEGAGGRAAPATLCGYVGGGVVAGATLLQAIGRMPRRHGASRFSPSRASASPLR